MRRNTTRNTLTRGAVKQRLFRDCNLSTNRPARDAKEKRLSALLNSKMIYRNPQNSSAVLNALLHYCDCILAKNRYVRALCGGSHVRSASQFKARSPFGYRKGQAIPVIENAGQWRKKRVTATVSNEIRRTIQRNGFYCRRLRSRDRQPRNSTASPSAARPTSGYEIANFQANANCRYRYHDHKVRSLSKRTTGCLTSESSVVTATQALYLMP